MVIEYVPAGARLPLMRPFQVTSFAPASSSAVNRAHTLPLRRTVTRPVPSVVAM